MDHVPNTEAIKDAQVDMNLRVGLMFIMLGDETTGSSNVHIGWSTINKFGDLKRECRELMVRAHVHALVMHPQTV